MGNFISPEGKSINETGREIELKEYFMSNGEVSYDLQREMEYTKHLAKVLVDRFHKENIVLSSHVVAFSAFNLFRSRNPDLDLYGLLRLPPEDLVIKQDVFREVIETVRKALMNYEVHGRVKLSSMIKKDADHLIEDGIKNQGIYHNKKPLMIDKEQNLKCEDIKLLFYYHNRLSGYGLRYQIDWNSF